MLHGPHFLRPESFSSAAVISPNDLHRPFPEAVACFVYCSKLFRHVL